MRLLRTIGFGFLSLATVVVIGTSWAAVASEMQNAKGKMKKRSPSRGQRS